MSENKGLLSGGYEKVVRNKRYIFWFWLLNLTLAEFGVSAFREQAHAILDNSLYSGGLVHGFDLGVFSEMLARPEFGPTMASMMPALYFAQVFFVFTVLFLPGVSGICVELPAAAGRILPRLRAEFVEVYPAADCGGHRHGNCGRCSLWHTGRSSEGRGGKHQRSAVV